jgi:PASTA domain-containing protein
MLNQARSARFAVAGLTVFAALALSGTASAVVPANDSFAAAQVLSGRVASVSGANVDATKEAGEPDHAGEPGGASIWYAWTAPAAGRATLSTCTGDVDTVLAVYTGAAVDDLDEVAADDDDCGEQSRVSFQASAGTLYRIAVDGVDGDSGPVELQLNLAPPNDDLAQAAVVAGEGGSVAGTTEGASDEEEEPLHYGVGSVSAWYSWTAPSTGWATFETCGTEFDTVLAAYTGSELADLAFVAGSDDACELSSRISFQATAGTAYRIAVAGWGGASGPFTLTWNRNPPPPEPPYAVDGPGIVGKALEGETLTAAAGQWEGAQPISFAYAWGRCDRDYERCGFINGANNRTYVPTAADVGWRMYVRVVASNVAGSGMEVSNLTPLVAARPPLNSVIPFVSGRARPGEILVTTSGEWGGTGPMSLAYQWQACNAALSCTDLAGEASPVIRVTAAHLGRSLRVVVTATNPGGSSGAESDLTAVVRNRPVPRCVIPNVKRRTVAAARRAIRRAGCRVGRIGRAYSPSVGKGRVISQSPRAGARRAAGSKVSLVLSRGKRR